MGEEEKTVVLDVGSWRTRAGFAGDDSPQIQTFTAIVNGDPNIDYDPANHVHSKSVQFPVVRGVLTDATAVEQKWTKVLLNDLRIDSTEYNLVLSEHELIPASNREKMSEICFETFNFRSFLLAPQSTLSLYSSGRFTGISVTLGYQSIRVVPTYHGLPIIHAISVANFGGKELTSYFGKLLSAAGYNFYSSGELNCLRSMTEAHSYVALNCQTEIDSNYDRYWAGWEMPDGTNINYGPDRCRVGEALFNPSVLDNVDSPGLPDLVFQSVQQCPEELRQELLRNIIVTGAVGKMSGVSERLTQDLRALVASTPYKEVKATKLPESDTAAWVGGSIVGSLSQRELMAMTLEDYNERGAKAVHAFFFSHV